MYWDQASVLVQLGLLDPKLVPKNMKAKGLKRLPVTGVESSRKVLNEDDELSNEPLSKWDPSSNQNESTSSKSLPVRQQHYYHPTKVQVGNRYLSSAQ